MQVKYLSDSSSNNHLTGNIASDNNDHGICLMSSSNNNLTNNVMSGNNYNFGVYDHFTQNIDTSNLVNGKPVYYWVDQKDKCVPDDAGFVGIVNSKNITVRDLTLTNSSVGILFAYTDNSRIVNVTASDNHCGICIVSSSNNNITSNTASGNSYEGIYLWYSSNNSITDNDASNNNDYGIYLYHHSSNNILAGNTASNNGWYGICLQYSSNNNIIHHNNLLNNTNNNAYDYDTNRWNTTTAGNYYSDYTNNDGIGDDPHPIPGGSNMDYHPLMNPWHDPQTPGDLNRDNNITPADAAITLDIAAGSRPCDPTTLAAADVSGDGKVTSLDALMILQAAAGNMSL